METFGKRIPIYYAILKKETKRKGWTENRHSYYTMQFHCHAIFGWSSIPIHGESDTISNEYSIFPHITPAELLA